MPVRPNLLERFGFYRTRSALLAPSWMAADTFDTAHDNYELPRSSARGSDALSKSPVRRPPASWCQKTQGCPAILQLVHEVWLPGNLCDNWQFPRP